MKLRKLSFATLALVAATMMWSGHNTAQAQQPAASQPLPKVEDLIGAYVTDASETAYPEVNYAIKQWLQSRNLNAARGSLRDARSKYKKLPPAEIMMAQLLAMTGNGPAARAELESGVRDFPDDPEFYIIFGDIAFQERRFTDAKLLFELADTLVPKYSGNEKRKRNLVMRAHAGNAAVLEAREEWDKAYEKLKAWLGVDNVNAPAHQRMGRCLFKQNKVKEAAEEFKKAADQDDKMLLADIMMARLYEEIVDHKAAVDAMKQAETVLATLQTAEQKQKYVSNMLAIAQWAVAAGDLEKAKKVSDLAYGRDKEALDAQLVCGIVARLSNDLASAKFFFEKANRQSPANFVATNNLALTLIESTNKDDKERALQLAAQNVNSAPRNSEAYATLGWVAYKADRKKEAAEALNVAMSSGQLSPDAGYYVAYVLFDSGKFPECKQVVDSVLANKSPFSMKKAAEELKTKVETQLKKSVGSSTGSGDKPK